jgi:hypothetical protein
MNGGKAGQRNTPGVLGLGGCGRMNSQGFLNFLSSEGLGYNARTGWCGHLFFLHKPGKKKV